MRDLTSDCKQIVSHNSIFFTSNLEIVKIKQPIFQTLVYQRANKMKKKVSTMEWSWKRKCHQKENVKYVFNPRTNYIYALCLYKLQNFKLLVPLKFWGTKHAIL